MSIVRIHVTERGSVGRGLKRAYDASVKQIWFDFGVEFHSQFSDARFTHAHASKAGYAQRSKQYERRKFKKFGHTYPLVWSGTARRLVRTANVVATKNGVSVRYAGARVFNFKNPKSQVNMREEFTKVLPEEAEHLVRFFETKLGQKLNSDNGANQ